MMTREFALCACLCVCILACVGCFVARSTTAVLLAFDARRRDAPGVDEWRAAFRAHATTRRGELAAHELRALLRRMGPRGPAAVGLAAAQQEGGGVSYREFLRVLEQSGVR